MKRTPRFVQVVGTVSVAVAGRTVEVPLAPGILKHRRLDDLAASLEDPVVARKYTREALRVAPWCVLRVFEVAWLRECLDEARIRESRRAAIEFLLDAK